MQNTNFFLRVICLLVIAASVLFYNGHKEYELQAEQVTQLTGRIDIMEAQQKELLEALQTYYEEQKNASVDKETQEQNAQEKEAEADSSDNYYTDGIYTGEAAGFGGTIQVEVTLENDTLTGINVLSAPGEDSAYLSQAKSVIDTVLGQQSTDVDTISGATFSSTGILNAIDNALEKAENK